MFEHYKVRRVRRPYLLPPPPPPPPPSPPPIPRQHGDASSPIAWVSVRIRVVLMMGGARGGARANADSPPTGKTFQAIALIDALVSARGAAKPEVPADVDVGDSSGEMDEGEDDDGAKSDTEYDVVGADVQDPVEGKRAAKARAAGGDAERDGEEDGGGGGRRGGGARRQDGAGGVARQRDQQLGEREEERTCFSPTCTSADTLTHHHPGPHLRRRSLPNGVTSRKTTFSTWARLRRRTRSVLNCARSGEGREGSCCVVTTSIGISRRER